MAMVMRNLWKVRNVGCHGRRMEQVYRLMSRSWIGDESLVKNAVVFRGVGNDSEVGVWQRWVRGISDARGGGGRDGDGGGEWDRFGRDGGREGRGRDWEEEWEMESGEGVRQAESDEENDIVSAEGEGSEGSFESEFLKLRSGEAGRGADANLDQPGVFGDSTAQFGVTEDMLDSLIAMKDFTGIEGLPPLDTILEQDVEKDKKAMRRELERKKQEELDKTRVKIVDQWGRAYGTGKRKTSIARVWLMEGKGQITINGKPHDVYFPDIDQRVQVLEPFWRTNTLGMFNVRSTVKGGGISGQSGALRHGISKALQYYDPSLRGVLKSEGMLTRDSRVVERKKPGKAKARKSYQWVKR